MRQASAFSVLQDPTFGASRREPRYASPRRSLALLLVTLTAMVFAAPEHRLVSALLATATFVGLQWLIPECRYRADSAYCAQNLAITLFLLKLVVVPALIMGAGPAQSVLPYLSSHTSMEWALVIDAVSYVGFCLGMCYISVRPRARKQGRIVRALSQVPSRNWGIAFLIIGAVGFVAAFGSVGRFIEYFKDPFLDSELSKEAGGSLKGFLATVLRPFFAIGLVAMWARQVDLTFRGRKLWRFAAGALVIAAGVVIANMTFSFNRAAFVFPLVSLVAVFSARVKRISPAMIALVAACAIPFLISLGHYRTTPVAGTEFEAPKSLFSSFEDLSEHLQVYITGPQYTGFFYQETGWGEHLLGGSSLVASTLSPIPILGKGSREASGLAMFNKVIYGNLGYEDQIIPFDCELFANFHLPGVVLGSFGLGMLLAWLQRLFDSVTSAFGLFTVHYIGIWGAMLSVWSLSIYVQILFYFCMPFYLFLTVNALRKLVSKTRRGPHMALAPMGELVR